MVDESAAKVRPFLFRAGARYRCFGDGLCCTDIHALGPLTRRELVQIRRIEPDAGARAPGFDQPMLRTKADGSCVFQLADRRCRIHAQQGHQAKPGGCRRFPLGLVATPVGGRVTTDHRCPCRTLGERPSLTEERVRPSLVDDAGRLVADRRVDRVSLDRNRHVSFARYVEQERLVLGPLLAGERPEGVLGADPFPRLRGKSWEGEAGMFVESADHTRFGSALGWFGDAILSIRQRRRPSSRARPWEQPFDSAEARAPARRSSDEVLVDWLADEVWALHWTDNGWSFARARAEMATRLAVARHITRRLRARKVRPERAAAEAVSIVDMVGASQYWEDVVDVMNT